MIDSRFEDTREGAVLRLYGELTVENAGILKDLLTASHGGRDRFSLDLTGITAADVAGLQVLCAAHRAWRHEMRTVKILGIAAAVGMAANEAGYRREEGCFPEKRRDCIWIEGGNHER